jgi:hypothetical protein
MTHLMDHEWTGAKGTAGFKDIFFIPIPMAMFGMCVAFMFGATIGLLVGKKHRRGAYETGPWMHEKGWMHHRGWGPGMGTGWKGWKGGGHHHHGFGTPPCYESHEDLPEPKEASAETS